MTIESAPDESEPEFTADGEWHWWMNLFLILLPFQWLYCAARWGLSGGTWPEKSPPGDLT